MAWHAGRNGESWENGCGKFAEGPGDARKAVAWYGKFAEDGDADAQFFLREDADKGVAAAQFQLGFMHANGRGVEKDEQAAIIWFRKAADQGNAAAQFQLGLMHAEGRGVAQDASEAKAWYQKAADQGNFAAKSKLWVLSNPLDKQNVQNKYDSYFARKTGAGTTAEPSALAAVEEATAAALRSAAKQGDPHAQFDLGRLYEDGNSGVEQQDFGAVVWYRKAARQGLAAALSRLGFLYENGRGVKEDPAEAAACYRKAADQGHAEAQLALARLYGAGRGVARDDREALAWLRAAAAQGLAEARTELADREFPALR